MFQSHVTDTYFMNKTNHLFAVLTAVCLLSACASPDGRVSAASLAGTQWQLLAIQSMDDAQGTTTISDPSRFTLDFGADGRASFRLDCNRGTGTWQANASSSDSGKLTFGPLATTRALCPPPRIDERVARDMIHVRSYLLKNGRLHMSLMADGGIYEWQPTPGAQK
jgi:heat shock protein HslJ